MQEHASRVRRCSWYGGPWKMTEPSEAQHTNGVPPRRHRSVIDDKSASEISLPRAPQAIPEFNICKYSSPALQVSKPSSLPSLPCASPSHLPVRCPLADYCIDMRIAIPLVSVLFATTPAFAYNLVREYSGSTFFDGWQFYGHHDNLTNGAQSSCLV